MRLHRRELNLSLPADPRAARAARTAVEDALASARPEVREDCQLLVSELVANSVRHGNLGPGDEVNVHVRASRKALRVEVQDPGQGFGSARPRPDGEGGYGLFLVDRLANRWGVETQGAVNVWFEMDRPFGERRSA